MKVGDYVRTKSGYIGKITSIDNEMNRVYYYTKKITSAVPTQDIVKYVESKEQIIDLIEVGDYVNGYLVKDIDYAFDDVVMNNKNARVVPYIDCNKNNYIDDIKSIVTKEQFKNMEYKVGEDKE